MKFWIGFLAFAVSVFFFGSGLSRVLGDNDSETTEIEPAKFKEIHIIVEFEIQSVKFETIDDGEDFLQTSRGQLHS
jgi:hypothetical protein